MKTFLLLIVIVAAVSYAIYNYYGKTDPAKSVLMRVVSSVGIAAAAAGALVMSLFQTGSGVPIP